MLDVTLSELLVGFSSVLLAIMLLTEILDCSKIFAPIDARWPMTSFGYKDSNVLDAWKMLYPDIHDGNQSAINITSRLAVVVQPSKPLEWIGYYSQPVAMAVANYGNTITVCGFWPDDGSPTLQGGFLDEIYDFHSMIFYWGRSDETGSEHTIDNVKYPLELQMIHVKRGFNSPGDAIGFGVKHGVVVVSIFYQVTNEVNHYLDKIVRNLWLTPKPGMKVQVTPFSLEGLFSPFEKNYYSYGGTLLPSSDNEVVSWIVQPQPMNLSSSQMKKFRSICTTDVPMHFEAKRIHRLHDRDLYYYE